MSLPNKSHRRKYYSHPSQYTMSLPMVKVIDISIRVTQVSTQCPYPMVRVIDVSVTVTQVSKQYPYPLRVIDISISHPSQYTMSLSTSMTLTIG
jgi:hypothetical protein